MGRVVGRREKKNVACFFSFFFLFVALDVEELCSSKDKYSMKWLPR